MPLPYAWPYALLFWGVFLWAFLPESRIVRRARQRVAGAGGGSRDAGSLQAIVLGQSACALVSFATAGYGPLRLPAALQRPAFYAGLALLAGGSLLRRHCWRVLGDSFTGDVAARPDQPVVDRGAYAWVRHPSYTAGTLMNLGVGLALGSWTSTLLMLAGSLVAYVYRIRVEERVLLATLGEPYRRYMAGRKRLVPFLY